MNEPAKLKLFRQAGKLKTIKRSGWLDHNIENPESVADHTFRVGFMAMILAKEMKIDPLKLMQMSLIHDLAESVVGDITPRSGISKEEKRAREEAAIKEFFHEIEDGEYWVEIWTDYEYQKSPEAVAVKNIDKLEMVLQAREYAERDQGDGLESFLSSAEKAVSLQQIKALFERATEDRKYFQYV